MSKSSRLRNSRHIQDSFLRSNSLIHLFISICQLSIAYIRFQRLFLIISRNVDENYPERNIIGSLPIENICLSMIQDFGDIEGRDPLSIKQVRDDKIVWNDQWNQQYQHADNERQGRDE